MPRQLIEYHGTIGHRFVPNIRSRVPHENGGYLVHTNSSGFRCHHEFAAEKSPGQLRLLLFGDSFSAGDGVSNDRRYGDCLERQVPGLQVYNFALPGAGADQQYLAYQEYGIEIEHDLLLIAVVVANIRRVAARYRLYADDENKLVVFAKPYFELEGGALRLCNVPPAREPFKIAQIEKDERGFIERGAGVHSLRKFVLALGLRDLTEKLTRRQPLPEYDQADSPAWLLMRAILEQWIRGQSKKVIVMPIPLYHYVEEIASPDAYQNRFRELTEATGATLHDPLPDLQRYPAAQRRQFRFTKDAHLTPQGHAALATSLAPAVERILEGIREPLRF